MVYQFVHLSMTRHCRRRIYCACSKRREKNPPTQVHLRIFGIVLNPNCEGGLQRLKVVDVAPDDLKRGKGTSVSSILGMLESEEFSPGIKGEKDGPMT